MNRYKLIQPGRVDTGHTIPGKLYVEIEMSGDGRLSITGVEGPRNNGDCDGSCGQCRDMAMVDYADGWTAEMVDRLRDTWDRWHLNDMKAGTPAQEAWLRDNPVNAVYPASHYQEACKALAAAGLNPDDGYRYGSAWLREEVPADVIDWLFSLPDSPNPLPGRWSRSA